MDNSMKPRNALIAFVFSILSPGLGPLYNGRIVRSLVYTFLVFILPVIYSILGFKKYFWAYVALLAFLLLIYLYIAIESAVIASRSKDYLPKKYNKWYVYFGFLICWFFLIFVSMNITVHSRYRSFENNSDSEKPYLNKGDMVVADCNYYENSSPTYGDLVIAPNSIGEDMIYRVIGLPGDSIIFENLLARFKNKESSFNLISNQLFQGYDAQEFEEVLPNKSRHRVLTVTEKVAAKEIVVPSDTYFLSCDNRLYLGDNRYWGFVNSRLIKGRILYVLYSSTLSQINKDLTN